MCQTEPAKNNMIERQVNAKAFLYVTEHKKFVYSDFYSFSYSKTCININIFYELLACGLVVDL